MKTGRLYDQIYEQWLAIDEFEQLAQEIVSNLKLARDCKREVIFAERVDNAPHPADQEFKTSAMQNAVELAKAYTEKAMLEDPSKLAVLSEAVNNLEAKKSRESVPKLIIGKLLLDFLKANDRLPTNKDELIDSADEEYRAEIIEREGVLGRSKLCSLGLEYYGLADAIKNKPGRKS